MGKTVMCLCSTRGIYARCRIGIVDVSRNYPTTSILTWCLVVDGFCDWHSFTHTQTHSRIELECAFGGFGNLNLHGFSEHHSAEYFIQIMSPVQLWMVLYISIVYFKIFLLHCANLQGSCVGFSELAIKLI